MATHSSTLAWRIPGTEEPGGLLSMGLHRVRQDWSDLACMHACIGKGNDSPLQYSCLENPRDRGAWWASIYGVAQSRTRLKRLSSSSISIRMGFPVVKNPPTTAGDTRDTGSISGLERFLGVGNGNTLQYSSLENSMDREPGGLQSMGSHRVGNWAAFL